jgi:INO80 complex subunit B
LEEQTEPDDSMEMQSTPLNTSSKGSTKGSKKKKNQQQDDTNNSSSEEERWLEAIESGKLEEVDDELKKIKPKVRFE